MIDIAALRERDTVDDPLDDPGQAVAEEQGQAEQEVPHAVQDEEEDGDQFGQD